MFSYWILLDVGSIVLVYHEFLKEKVLFIYFGQKILTKTFEFYVFDTIFRIIQIIKACYHRICSFATVL